MKTKVSCPNCSRVYDVEESMVGKTANCKACNTSFAVQTSVASGGGGSVRPPAPAAPPAPPAGSGGPLIGGRYRELRELGRGAFGVVIEAFDTQLERKVAIKMLLPEALASADAVSRFFKEAKVLAELGHPNVVPIFDKGEHERGYYIVCKMVRGQTLAELLPKGGFADPRVAVGYAITLARTLHSVYEEHSVLHRDIKPANMMLEKDHLYLMDFGMAACHDKNPLGATPEDEQGMHTVAGSAVGTPAYMPPEQAFFDRDQIGPWSDIYSAGAVLYHMLTGSLPVPWRGKILDILQVEPLPPSKRRPDLDPALDRIILKTLQKKCKDRYQNGAAFAADLQNWLDGSRTASVPALPAVPAPLPAVPQPQPLPPPPPERPVEPTGATNRGGRSTSGGRSTVGGRSQTVRKPERPQDPEPDFELVPVPTPATKRDRNGAKAGRKRPVVAIVGIGLVVIVLTVVGLGISLLAGGKDTKTAPSGKPTNWLGNDPYTTKPGGK